MKYTFRPYHIVTIPTALFFIWLFISCWTTGWEHGFFCTNKSCKNNFQEIIRVSTSMIVGIILLLILCNSEYEKEFYIGFKNKPTEDPNNPDHPNYKEFQEFLKEKGKLL